MATKNEKEFIRKGLGVSKHKHPPTMSCCLGLKARQVSGLGGFRDRSGSLGLVMSLRVVYESKEIKSKRGMKYTDTFYGSREQSSS